MFKKLFYNLFTTKKQKQKQKEEAKMTTLEAERLERNRVLHSTRLKQKEDRLSKANPVVQSPVHPIDLVLASAALLAASSTSQAGTILDAKHEQERERENDSVTYTPTVSSFDYSSISTDTSSSSSCDSSSCCDSSPSY